MDRSADKGKYRWKVQFEAGQEGAQAEIGAQTRRLSNNKSSLPVRMGWTQVSKNHHKVGRFSTFSRKFRQALNFTFLKTR